jgi:hypothetical protein
MIFGELKRKKGFGQAGLSPTVPEPRGPAKNYERLHEMTTFHIRLSCYSRSQFTHIPLIKANASYSYLTVLFRESRKLSFQGDHRPSSHFLKDSIQFQ